MPDNCSRTGRKLSAYLDGTLAPADRTTVEAHTGVCSSCSGELRTMAAVDMDIKRLPVIEPSPFFAARVAAAVRSANRSVTSLRRFLRLPVPAMALMIAFIFVNLFTFAFNINAMENGPRRELARKVISQLVRPASLINPVALARLCGECNKYMCLCMHEEGKQTICPCKDCQMKKRAGAGKKSGEESMEGHNVH